MLGETHNPSVATPAAAAASSDLRMMFSLGRRADGALFGCDVMSLSSYADRFNHPACLVGAHAPMRGFHAGIVNLFALEVDRLWWDLQSE